MDIKQGTISKVQVIIENMNPADGYKIIRASFSVGVGNMNEKHL